MRKPQVKLCVESQCSGKRYCFGRCSRHFKTLDTELLKRLRAMPRAQRMIAIEQRGGGAPVPPWEFEGDSEALAAMTARNRKF